MEQDGDSQFGGLYMNTAHNKVVAKLQGLGLEGALECGDLDRLEGVLTPQEFLDYIGLEFLDCCLDTDHFPHYSIRMKQPDYSNLNITEYRTVYKPTLV